jgi:hypothetical protein
MVTTVTLEFQVGDTRKDSTGAALDAYQAAGGIASTDLPPTHPISLGLALNFSVFTAILEFPKPLPRLPSRHSTALLPSSIL